MKRALKRAPAYALFWLGLLILLPLICIVELIRMLLGEHPGGRP